MALRAAKKYDERETVTWVRQISKYAVFISSVVDADGNLFKEVIANTKREILHHLLIHSFF